MTDAQWEVRLSHVHAKSQWEDRTFRKECVTQGIVKFSNEDDVCKCYTVRYRGLYVATLWGDTTDKYKLMTMWNVIRTAEQLLKAEQFVKGIEGVKHESN